jgi:hypothetical protein
LTDNVFTVSPVDKQGNPSQQIAVSYVGPSGAGTVTATLYVWDALTHQYYVVSGSSAVTLTSNNLTLFPTVALGATPVVRANLADGIPGATDYVLVVNPSGLTTVGTYTFAMANVIGEASVSVGSAFTPKALPGLVYWLRSDLGITLNGSKVSGWADQSGNGNNFAQPTSAKQPAYSATSFGGLPGLGFVQASVNCMQSSATIPLGGATEVTLFMVMFRTITTVSIVYEMGPATQASPFFGIYQSDLTSGDFGYGLFQSSGANGTTEAFTPGATATSPFQHNAVYNANLGNVARAAVRYNRTSETTSHTSSGSPSATSFSVDQIHYIGARAAVSLGTTMTLAEVVLCTGDQTASIPSFEAYAKNLWGLP